MLADKLNIENYIPHREPMVMIDALIEATSERAVSMFTIEKSNLFVLRGVFTEPGLIENIAQTAAAHAGYLYSKKDVPIPIGFIASISDLEVIDLPVIDSSIQTVVTVTNRIFDVTIVRGVIEQAGRTLCSCEMKIFIKA